MSKATGHGFKKHLSLALLILSLLMNTSCTTEDEDKYEYQTQKETETAIPDETLPRAAMPEEIGYTVYERSTASNVYLNKENVGNLKESELRAKLTELAAKTDIEPVNATINSTNWKITKGKTGKKLNVELTLERLLGAPEGEKISPVIEKVNPSLSSENLAANIKVKGSFTTRLLNRTRNRVNNIELAAKEINYYKLMPGEEFSFNNAIGRRTKDKGYEKAIIFVRTKTGTKEILAYGGGICQLSTTLFNAAEKGGLEILERHRHSKKVAYVAAGKDATVSYGSADLRFRNTGLYPVMIRTSLSNRYLNVKIIENRNITQ